MTAMRSNCLFINENRQPTAVTPDETENRQPTSWQSIRTSCRTSTCVVQCATYVHLFSAPQLPQTQSADLRRGGRLHAGVQRAWRRPTGRPVSAGGPGGHQPGDSFARLAARLAGGARGLVLRVFA